MPLLYLTGPTPSTVHNSWFGSPFSAIDMDEYFFPHTMTRQQAMCAQARSQARVERARRQRLEAQRRETMAARVLAIETARQQAMQEEYERRQRKARAIRRQQERQRQEEEQRLRALHLQKQHQRALQQHAAFLRHSHDEFDVDNWPFGSRFLPSGFESLLNHLIDHHESEPQFEFHLTLENPPEPKESQIDQTPKQGTSQAKIDAKLPLEANSEKVSEAESIPMSTQSEQAAPAPTASEIVSQATSVPTASEIVSQATPVPTASETDSQAPSTPSAPTATETESPDQSQTQHQNLSTEPKIKHQTVLFHPFTPTLARDSASVDPSKIQVDIKDNRVTVSGLWSLDPCSRSLSPNSKARATHVRDVDENDEEILLPHDTDDSEEEGNESDNVTVTKTVDLPAGVTADQVHADLTDQGFIIWTA